LSYHCNIIYFLALYFYSSGSTYMLVYSPGCSSLYQPATLTCLLPVSHYHTLFCTAGLWRSCGSHLCPGVLAEEKHTRGICVPIKPAWCPRVTCCASSYACEEEHTCYWHISHRSFLSLYALLPGILSCYILVLPSVSLSMRAMIMFCYSAHMATRYASILPILASLPVHASYICLH